jgi:hypothetical protein
LRGSVHTGSSKRELHKNWLSRKRLFLKGIFLPAHGPRLATRKSEVFVELHAVKTAIVLSVIILASIGPAANAAQVDSFNYSDIEVISVQPRATTVKPFVMAIFTEEQRQRMATAAFQKRAFPPKNFNPLR